MVGIVIVSHSAKLAEGLRDLAEQMGQGEISLAIAAGIDDPDQPIGTDAMQVHAAIEAVYSPDGVVILMDLGSALLSAETALEFLSPEQRENVYLSAAPLVEGTIAAVVQAAVGSDVQQVIQEAQGALAAKVEHIGQADAGQAAGPTEMAAPTPAPPEGETRELEIVVRNRQGLHARPAANFVKTASGYEAEIWVYKGEKRGNAKSINQVATLGVRQGEQIRLNATGPDAEQALSALQALADENFGEAETPAEPPAAPTTVGPAPSPAAAGTLAGIPASPGIAIGPAFLYRPELPEIVTRKVEDGGAEWRRLEAAIAEADQEIAALHARAVRQVGPSEAAIFEAHQLFLQDPDLLEAARTRIMDQQLNAEAAWQQAIEGVAEEYRALDDAYMQARAADILDVGRRVLGQLVGVTEPALDLDEPAILVAADLSPSDTAQLDPEKVIGLCTELGGATSHSAILARALGIPAVVGLDGALRRVAEAQVIALDGQTGRLWLDPDAEQLAELEAQRAAWQKERRRNKEAAQQPAITQDGKGIEVAANIGGPHDAKIALEFGAEGVGLFRTEFLFMERAEPPSEEEQWTAYRQAAEVMEQRPLIIRTLDVGGDKPIPYLDLDEEANPFLGQRGIRYCLEHPEMFKAQLRAILRAGSGHNVKLMFPMIGSVAELRAAKGLLEEARAELQTEAHAFDAEMEIGIMIEVPAAVTMADQLAVEVDFFSIGTNDLTQYVMAADRGNARVAELVNALHPAVLRLMRQTVRAAREAGIWVGLCGELAGNVLATPVLMGLGLDELSMSAPNIPAVKATVREWTMERARQVAAEVLALESAEAVETFLGDWGPDLKPLA